MKPAIRRCGRRGAVLALPVVLASCFTMTLWGFDLADEVDPVTGTETTGFDYDERTEWSWGLFFARLGLTPFTVVLDVVTSPVQAVLFGWDDGEEACCPK